ncbi:MAG: type II toxin-antitoxin system HicB family antitoxin [Bacteroidia bacterium]|nr:type II toxin-antitoxin system HicB family antitoxin [Bacteroidia bacterium]
MINTDDVQIELSREFQSYIAEVPELPGCIANGETEIEAIENVKLIISEWMNTAKTRAELRALAVN